MTRAPREPSADLREAASIIHQTYTALLLEGFTEPQALVIVGQILAANRPGAGGS